VDGERGHLLRVPAARGGTGRDPHVRALRADQRWRLFFVKKFAPETRGRTLEELEDDFRTHDAGHFVHEAPAGVRGG
jgi:hypothetical protein